jgi:sialidase-1
VLTFNDKRSSLTFHFFITTGIAILLGGCAQSGIAPSDRAILSQFLGDPTITIDPLFKGQRFPNIVTTLRGTLIASWGSTEFRVKRSINGGETWGPEIYLGGGISGGGLTVDENTGNILAFSEAEHPPAQAMMYLSQDDGKTWQSSEPIIDADSVGNDPDLSMNEKGITLKSGPFKGRLIRPSRWYAGKNEKARWHKMYSNAIFSDDGGQSWSASQPFPALGTGEGAIVELFDGSLYYNSRRHWAPPEENSRRRWIARSYDGGESWTNLEIEKALPDGDQSRDYGLMGGLTRLPLHNNDILVFSNIDSNSNSSSRLPVQASRRNGTIWASFDGGRTWPIKRLVSKEPFAYSALTVGAAGTASQGLIYLHFEDGVSKGSSIAKFNLSWILGGESTSDGKLPHWVLESNKQ